MIVEVERIDYLLALLCVFNSTLQTNRMRGRLADNKKRQSTL